MPSASNSNMPQEDAKSFLEGLKIHLNKSIPPSDEVMQRMQNLAADARRKNPKLQEVPHEGLFVDSFVLRPTNEYLVSAHNLTPDEACKSFLVESTDARKSRIAERSPVSANRYPFKKEFSAVNKVVKSWWNKSKESPVSQACPDLAICFPHTVVFEAKYFRKGGIDAARSELVRGIYQCFYYRGLPAVSGTKKHAAWGYDYQGI